MDKEHLPVLDDRDLAGDLGRSLRIVLGAVEEALLAHAEGALLAPPRFALEAGRGRLVFTVGAETARSKSLGFRVYETFPERSPGHTQLVAVWDGGDGRFLGLVIGNLLGALRTAALNAIALRHLAPPGARVLGVLGTGFQARHHVLAALAVHPFERVVVYSRNPENRAAFVRWLAGYTNTPVEAVAGAEEAVRPADVVLELTNARRPVFDPAWLKEGVHVHTVGPKRKGAHALPLEVALGAELLVGDAPEQLAAYGDYFLPPEARTRVVPLSALVAGAHPGRTGAAARTVFLSAGLAGTEPVAARRLLEAMGKEEVR